MSELFDKILGLLEDPSVTAVASNPLVKSDKLPAKLKIRPVVIKGERKLAVTKTVGTKELRENLSSKAAAELIYDGLCFESDRSEQHYKQVEIKTDSTNVVILASKRGHLTVRERKQQAAALPAEGQQAAGKVQNETTGTAQKKPADSLANDRRKNYVLPEGSPVPFLVELGVMNKDGYVVKARYDKFRQINRYLEFVEDVIPSLPKGREISIIDFGCGKSYLTFALYYYLHEVKGFDVRITGLDLKEDVIRNCNELAVRFGYSKLNFLHGDIADYTGTDSVDMVVTLHACDTATDYALYKAIKWGARVIFCVPCCQHELNRTISDARQKSVLKYGLIKERMAALYTDALRANMLEEQGYKVQVLEFIDMEHTPKNILIRAMKAPKQMLTKAQRDRIGEENDYTGLMEELNVTPTLYRLLNEGKDKI